MALDVRRYVDFVRTTAFCCALQLAEVLCNSITGVQLETFSRQSTVSLRNLHFWHHRSNRGSRFKTRAPCTASDHRHAPMTPPSASRPVVFLTGCSTGIGHHMAAEFFARGCIVYATARKVESLSALPEGVHKLYCDILHPESIKAAVDQVIKEQGRVDILVNNAGFGTTSLLAEHDAEDARTMVDTNILGPLAVTQAVVPHMAAQASGKIINIGSILGFVTLPLAGLYCATKYAVRSLTEAMGFELAPFGIQVCLVAPGMIETEIWRKQAEGLHVEKYKVHAPHGAAARRVLEDMHAMPKTSADAFAKSVVGMALRRRIPRHYWVGKFATMYWFMSWLPRWLLELGMCFWLFLVPVRPKRVKAA